MTPPALRPAGAPDDPAITWRGETWTYAELRERITAAPRAPVTDISRMTVPEALACCFAAAESGDAVLVSAPELPPATVTAVPAGTWLIASTSGTSGHPRLVCRTAASWAASVTPLARAAGLDADDRVALTGPLHATLHLHAAVHTLAIGAHLIDDVAAATAVHCVPAVLDSLLAAQPLPPGLRTAVVAGTTLPDAVAARAAGHGIATVEYYGAAETSFVAVRRWPDPLLRPFPGADLRTDEDGTLWVRSPYLALGYGAVSEAGGSAGRIRPLRSTPDGFVTVGDLVFTPAGGPMAGIAIRGRGSSAITAGGFTVQAEDIEAVLQTLPGVRAVAVVGLPRRRLGQIVVAAVELDGTRTLAEVRAAARGQFSGLARPRRYVELTPLPRTPSGKVARGQVAALLRQDEPASGTVL